MTDLKFVLSNPPHRDPDPGAAASIFGLTAAEARIKLNFPGPDVWFAGEDHDDLEAKATGLRDLGANAEVTSAGLVAGLSKRIELRRFAFGSPGMTLEASGQAAVTVPYHWAVTVVVCRPMARETVVRKTMRQAAKDARQDKSHRQRARMSLTNVKTHTDESFVDVYFTHENEVLRATIRPGCLDYSALGEAKKVVERENMLALVEEMRRRFTHLREDRRLENAPAPRINLLGERTLRGHLETIDPRLKDVDDYDLMSRLAFLAG